MKRETFALLFYPRNDKIDKNKTVPIFMRITIRGERLEFSINRRVKINKWKDGRVLGYKNAKEINQYMLYLTNHILYRRIELLDNDQKINTSYFRELLNSEREPKVKTKLKELNLLKIRLQSRTQEISILTEKIKQLEIELYN